MSHSFIDPNGRVFEWNGEIFRAISHDYAPFCRNLFEKGILEKLTRDKLIVESDIVDWSVQPGDLVLRHRKVPVLSYCFEWPAPMLKRAALLTIDLCIQLTEHDLTLQDAHPWNILFDGTRPIFVDLTSIVPARGDILWAPYQQFCNFFLFPLYLYSAKQERVARWLLHDILCGVTHEDLARALPIIFKLCHPVKAVRISTPKLLAKATEKLPAEIQSQLWNLSKRLSKELVNKKTRLRFFNSLRNEIEDINLPSVTSHWSKYYRMVDQPRFKTEFSPQEWAPKEQSFLKIIRDTKPQTVLDVGCNTGRYARLAAENGARVIACEIDSAAVNQCYEEADKKQLNVLPLLVNAFNPAPSYGRGGAECPSVNQRFQSDLVVALALIHHVVANQRLDIALIVQACKSLSTRRLLIEFVPPLSPRPGASSLHALDYYTLDTLVATLGKHFKSVVPYESFPEDRKLFLCEK